MTMTTSLVKVGMAKNLACIQKNILQLILFIVQGMKTHGAQIPPDLHPPKLIEQLTRVIQRAKELSNVVKPKQGIKTAYQNFHL